MYLKNIGKNCPSVVLQKKMSNVKMRVLKSILKNVVGRFMQSRRGNQLNRRNLNKYTILKLEIVLYE